MRPQDFNTPAASVPAVVSAGREIEIAQDLNLPGFIMGFAPNEEIFGEEEPTDFVYKVVSGAVRTTRFLADGRRQIDAFHLAGDVFGLERGEAHRFSAEAIGECEVALVRRKAVERVAESDVAAARRLWSLAADNLEQLQDHMLLLSRKNAAERVGAFLLELSARASCRTVDLPMSRGDIADYLGLTLETVSRTFSQFAREGLIELPTPRRVVIRNVAALTIN
ncbi:MAG TPA: helix-turn-helix domain-containing protein [Caulobacteraceae bacterium]|jgi:CRP/FNR family nitrogen fixation transcriptional regulator